MKFRFKIKPFFKRSIKFNIVALIAFLLLTGFLGSIHQGAHSRFDSDIAVVSAQRGLGDLEGQWQFSAATSVRDSFDSSCVVCLMQPQFRSAIALSPAFVADQSQKILVDSPTSFRLDHLFFEFARARAPPSGFLS